MKKQILTAFIASALISFMGMGLSSFSKPHKPKKPKTEVNKKGIVWADTLHDFGSVNMGPELVYTFTFKNKTAKTVTIIAAEPGCSCTVSEFTKNPIDKGKSGSVTAKYATQNRQGFFKKFIKVTFEDGTYQSLVITGTVVTP